MKCGSRKRFSICGVKTANREDVPFALAFFSEFKMQVHRTLPNGPLLDNCALTTGTFDGVHCGHQALIERLRSESLARGLSTVALTFEDMPICLLRPDVCPALLTLPQEKIRAFEKTGLDHLFIVPFTREIASQGARQWMQTWVDNIGLKLFVGGPDFALGRNREGTITQLSDLGGEMGFEVLALREKITEGDLPISSTRFRDLICQQGGVEKARAFLNRPYEVSGRVVTGQRLGRTIGFPTINIEPNPRKCVPLNGVYAVHAHWEGRSYLSALNIGLRPTVDGTRRQIEFHVIDQKIETPPKEVTLEFVSRLRGERKFASLQSLAEQLKEDVARIRLLAT